MIEPRSKRMFDKSLPGDENKLGVLISDLKQDGQILLAYYTRKISHGKRHQQALIALARRRCDILFAMTRDGVFYTPWAS